MYNLFVCNRKHSSSARLHILLKSCLLICLNEIHDFTTCKFNKCHRQWIARFWEHKKNRCFSPVTFEIRSKEINLCFLAQKFFQFCWNLLLRMCRSGFYCIWFSCVRKIFSVRSPVQVYCAWEQNFESDSKENGTNDHVLVCTGYEWMIWEESLTCSERCYIKWCSLKLLAVMCIINWFSVNLDLCLLFAFLDVFTQISDTNGMLNSLKFDEFLKEVLEVSFPSLPSMID